MTHEFEFVYITLSPITAIANFRHVEGDKIEPQPMGFIRRLSNDDEDSLPFGVNIFMGIDQ